MCSTGTIVLYHNVLVVLCRSTKELPPFRVAQLNLNTKWTFRSDSKVNSNNILKHLIIYLFLPLISKTCSIIILKELIWGKQNKDFYQVSVFLRVLFHIFTQKNSLQTLGSAQEVRNKRWIVTWMTFMIRSENLASSLLKGILDVQTVKLMTILSGIMTRMICLTVKNVGFSTRKWTINMWRPS